MGQDPQLKALAHTEDYTNLGKGDGLEEDVLEQADGQVGALRVVPGANARWAETLFRDPCFYQ